jgi:hypothetical protein
MSGATYERYESDLSSYRNLESDDTWKERSKRLSTARSSVHTKSTKPREERKISSLYDADLVRSKITKPDAKAECVHVVIVDNSGSNKVIAEHIRKASGYLTSVLNTVNAASQIAFMYYSDHGDGANINQEIDFVYPDKKGDVTLLSSLEHVSGANGFDAPEAFECALHEACEIDFNKAKKKHLYLITDVVAHGMGMAGDSGCPLQRSWEDSVEEVYKTYDTFEVVGCSGSTSVAKLQAKFLKAERVAFDLIDLSSIDEEEHRAAVTANALLFLIARKTGLQGVKMFLSFLYEKWLSDPIFGDNTDMRARDMIKRFGKFLEFEKPDIDEMIKKIIDA